MSQNEFLLLFFGGSLIAALFIAFQLESKRIRYQLPRPGARGYLVGYTFAIWPMVVLGGFFAIGMLTGHIAELFTDPDIAAALVALTIFSACGIGMIHRNRWAFLIYIILTFMPIVYIILGIYLGLRWREMGPMPEVIITPEVTVVGEEEGKAL